MDTHEVTGAMREAAGKAERKYGEFKERAREAAEELTGSADLESAATGVWNNLLGMVQDNPGAAIGISLLAGAGLGALIAYLARD